MAVAGASGPVKLVVAPVLAAWAGVANPAGAGRFAAGPALAGLLAGAGGLICGDGRQLLTAAAARVCACSGAGVSCLDGLGAVGFMVANWLPALCLYAECAIIFILLRFQRAGGQSAQHGVKARAAAQPGCGAGYLQHAAVAGFLCRWLVGRLGHAVVAPRRFLPGVAL